MHLNDRIVKTFEYGCVDFTAGQNGESYGNNVNDIYKKTRVVVDIEFQVE